MSENMNESVTASNDDLAELLRKREHAKPNRWTWVLIGALILAVGFVGGAFVGKQSGGSGGSIPDFSASGGFPGGGLPGQSGESSDSASSDGTTAGGQLPTGGPGGMGGMTFGQIASIGDTSLTVTDQSGNEITVTVSDNTSITRQADISLQDLAVGTTVVVRGETGDDGSVAAQSISEGGGFGGMGMPGSGQGAPAMPGADQNTDQNTDQSSNQDSEGASE